jgi:CopG antitoxin of type II toxin-antitoxin system
MKLPETDSIRELAEFWDTHDVTDFADELVEVSERVFAHSRAPGVTVPLTAGELKALRDLAASRGVDEAELIRSWMQEKLHH